MCKISVQNLPIAPIDCVSKNTKLLDILLQNTDVMHACGGKGKCTTCKVKIIKGASTPAVVEAETKFRSLKKLAGDERLSCQISPTTSMEIVIPESSKLPHLNYLD